MLAFRLYVVQRISALVMAPMVLLHLGSIIYAVQNGMDASEILSRTQGSIFWGLFYGTFVLAVSLHAAIGMRVILNEWFGWSGKLFDFALLFFSLALLLMGGRAVWAVVVA